jgi:hypothetical protein
MPSSDFQPLFIRLRAILQKHANKFSVADDTAGCFRLQAPIGPATLKAWGGKVKRPIIPVAWVEIGKAYVSFHLMGLYGNTKLTGSMSKTLQARMQGKTCFNFKTLDAALVKELEKVTAKGLAAFKKTGFVL